MKLTPRVFWIGVVCALSLLGVAMMVVRGRVIDARWAEMLAELNVYEQQLLDREDQRDVLFGASNSGDAHEFYLAGAAIAEALDAGLFEEALGEVFPEPGFVEPNETRARRELIAHAGEALAQLRQGTHATQVAWPIPDPGPAGPSAAEALGLRLLGSLAWLDALEHMQEGRAAAAVESMLDALQFAHDLGASRLMLHEVTASSLLFPACVERAFAAGCLADLDEASRAVLAAGLARSIADTELRPRCWDDEFCWGVHLLETATAESGSAFTRGNQVLELSPKRLFSLRLEIVDHFAQTRELLQLLSANLASGLGGVDDALASIDESATHVDNWASKVMWSHLPGPLKNRARAQAKLHLLCAAITILRGEPDRMRESLVDPYLIEHVRLDDSTERILLTVDGHPDWRLEVGRN